MINQFLKILVLTRLKIELKSIVSKALPYRIFFVLISLRPKVRNLKRPNYPVKSIYTPIRNVFLATQPAIAHLRLPQASLIGRHQATVTTTLLHTLQVVTTGILIAV